MYKLKFSNGTSVPADYQQVVSKLVSDACDAQDALGPDGLDDLERETQKGQA